MTKRTPKLRPLHQATQQSPGPALFIPVCICLRHFMRDQERLLPWSICPAAGPS
jgi:hypothetical protein